MNDYGMSVLSAAAASVTRNTISGDGEGQNQSQSQSQMSGLQGQSQVVPSQGHSVGDSYSSSSSSSNNIHSTLANNNYPPKPMSKLPGKVGLIAQMEKQLLAKKSAAGQM